ncbi:MAG: hypothetical protein HN742_26780 [Lentisphaerae bacterium]|jgi:hypothetical protein|nr:hypothetical protein [Lentisphaerota bacterium]MBT4817936.1 hypothetical protein [Lentisphaerota bacterium]MBT5606191.1 hypothetical protein [Lentisphaerota bacterium]MBT7057722.1 hypothetical protein [Lentisphaerota bacterium]MBT7845508.1 hypothetical protein [Lentisphaerota bacterium]
MPETSGPQTGCDQSCPESSKLSSGRRVVETCAEFAFLLYVGVCVVRNIIRIRKEV